jgi:hypothetical protein
MAERSIDSIRAELRALASTFVPEAAAFDERRWREIEVAIDGALASRPNGLRRQLVAFVRVLDVAARLRYGTRLASLDPERRLTLLRGFERAPVLALRRGVWALRTLVFLAYYTRDDVMSALGYSADPEGWAARGGTVSVVPLRPSEVLVEPDR